MNLARINPRRSTLSSPQRLEASEFARRLDLGMLVMVSVGQENAYACAGDGQEFYAKDVEPAVLARHPAQPHAQILAVVGMGNNGWLFRFALTPQQRELAEAAADAGALRRVWRQLYGHPMQQAYALPMVI